MAEGAAFHVHVVADGYVVRVMPEQYRVTFAQAVRILGSEQYRAVLDMVRAIHGDQYVSVLRQALASVDQDEMFRAARARVQERLWDGISPINGVQASDVRAAHHMAEDTMAYVIAIDGQDTIFQPCPQYTTVAEVEQAMRDHADRLAADMARARIIDEVAERILEG